MKIKIFSNWFCLGLLFIVLAAGCSGGGGGGGDDDGASGNSWASRGPDSGAMSFFVVNPVSRSGRVLNEYFVAGPGGVFYTTDNGATFSERTSGLPTGQIQYMVGSFTTPTVLYVAISDLGIGHGIYYSEDGGVSWHPTEGITFTAADQYEIVLEITDTPSRRVYAAVYNVTNPSTKLYFRSVPNTVWSERTVGVAINRIRDIDINPRNVDQIYVAHSAGVGYYNGTAWTNIAIGDKYSLAVRYGGDGTTGNQDDFIAGDLTGFYKSLDRAGGDVNTGTVIDNQWVNSAMLQDRDDQTNTNPPVEAYVGSPDMGNDAVGAMHITDVFSAAPTYTRVDQGLAGTSPPGANGLAVGFNSNGANDVIHRGSFYEGVQFRDTDGANFATFNNGMKATSINDLLINQNSADGAELLAGTNSGLFYSSNSGLTWSRIDNSIENSLEVSEPGRDMHIATIDTAYNNFLLGIGTDVYTYDRGTGAITQDKNFSRNVNAMAPAPTNNDIFVTGDGLWRNTSGTWTRIQSAPSNWHSIAATVDGAVVYAGAQNLGVYKGTRTSIDTFAQLNDGVIPTASTPQALACNVTNGDEVYAGFATEGVYFSSNQGVNWEARNNGLSAQAKKIYDIAIGANSSQVYIATDAGVYYSLDSGLTWQSRNSGLSSRQQKIRALDVFFNNNNIVYMGTDNHGVFHSTSGGK